MRTLKAAAAAASLAAILGLVVVLPGSARTMKGEPAPNFTGTTLDGKKVALADFRGKHPVVLNFYADFCPPCRKEFPHLKAMDGKLGPKGLKVIAVSLDEDRPTAAALPKATGARFPVVFDPSGGIAAKYGVQAIPHTVVIDRDGKVHAEIIGLDTDKLDRAVEQVMK
jgi:cytochrome c biogenesis protein CcmG, thiol:disulfide interchange protein DsbE